MKIHNFVGIDLSYYSTGVCLYNTKNGYKFFLISNKRKMESEHITYIHFKPIQHDNIMIACQIGHILSKLIKRTDLILLEDVAYGMFRNTEMSAFHGVVQYILRTKVCNDIMLVSPVAIKKFATGKGRASKDEVIDAFIKETDITCKESDVADSYFICKYGVQNFLHT